MSLNVEIVTTPGLHDMLEDDSAPDRLVNQAISDFRATPWVAESDLADDFNEGLAQTDEAGPRAAWDAVRGWLRNEKRTVVDEVWQNVTVGVLWLQLPDAAGAESTLTIAETTGNELKATCDVPGIGGGISTSFKITGKVEHSAASTERCELSVKAKFQKIEVTRNGKFVDNVVQLVEWGDKTIDFIVDAPPAPPAGVVPVRSYWNPSKAPDDVIVTQDVSRETSWTMKVGLSVPKLGIDTSVSATNSFQRDVTYKWVLPGGKSYELALYPKTVAPYVWTVK